MDTKTVESHVNTVSQGLKELAEAPEFDELITIVHRPGWTTKAEALLVAGMLETMNAHVQHLTTMKRTLIAGARAIGAK